MNDPSRRHFLGLGALGVGSVIVGGADQDPQGRSATPRATEGPYYVAKAPYRAKVSPPGAEGTLLTVSGRVRDAGSGKPLSGALLEVWQADHAGEYSAGENGGFENRARVLSSESAHYEFETIHPSGYPAGRGRWRSAHIHFKVHCAGHRTLTTQLFFAGDPKQDVDWLFDEKLVRPVQRSELENGRTLERVVFDLFLERA